MTEKQPKVSIVLPTHNGSKYIRASIDSCLSQTYKNIELVIVDDASTDGTARIIAGYRDPRIIYLRNKTNLRLPNALNTGFNAAGGEYLTWTSDDNYYAAEAIERMLDFLLRNGQDFVYCDYFIVRDGARDQPKPVFIPDTATFREINFVRACFLYSRKVKEAIGDYDPQTELSEDYDYWIRVSKKFFLNHLKTPLYYYRLHDQALYSRRYWEQEVTKCLVRLRHGLFLKDEAVQFFARLWIKKRKLPLKRIFYPFALYFFGRPLAGLLAAFEEQRSGFAECKDLVTRRIL